MALNASACESRSLFDLQVTRAHQIESPMVSKYEWPMCIKSSGPWTRYINDPYGLNINDPYAPNLNNLHEPNVNTYFYQIWVTVYIKYKWSTWTLKGCSSALCVLSISQTLGAGRQFTMWEEGKHIGYGTARDTAGSPVMLAVLPLFQQKHVWGHVHEYKCAHPYLHFSILGYVLASFIKERVNPLFEMVILL